MNIDYLSIIALKKVRFSKRDFGVKNMIAFDWFFKNYDPMFCWLNIKIAIAWDRKAEGDRFLMRKSGDRFRKKQFFWTGDRFLIIGRGDLSLMSLLPKQSRIKVSIEKGESNNAANNAI